MEIRYTTDKETFKRMTTDDMRKTFVIDNMFCPDVIQTTYIETERSIIGSAIPIKSGLKLLSSKKEMSAEYFTERREIGVINLGGSGKINTDNDMFQLEEKDMLYIGRGTKLIEFNSIDLKKPACFYFVSYPAHKEYPTKLIKMQDAEHAKLGSTLEANKRVINKYIHPNGVKSCQIVMGLTELEAGSVWNTMPVHTHQRRSEVYMYFGMPENGLVIHLMGSPDQTRHLILRNFQPVISPIWSIHSGCGTQNYSFIWAMGGENQDFGDMDPVEMKDLF
jgi:4-deoxy-L-threo-5-hexosulose-uronate ketol-isomerase